MNKQQNTFTYLLVIVFLFIGNIQKGKAVTPYNKGFTNEELLFGLFDKLYEIKNKKNGKVNIVHIGDSHIQADFLTEVIRQKLQSEFGNSGYGFTFPYSIVKSNGSRRVKYTTNIETWETSRNMSRTSDIKVGLSGFGLSSLFPNFSINIEADNPYEFNTIKILYPNVNPPFVLSESLLFSPKINNKTIESEPVFNKSAYSYHRVQSGETLYRLSVNYKVSVDEIKRSNKLTSNTIRLGQMIKIPKKNNNPKEITQAKLIKPTSSDIPLKDTLTTKHYKYYSEFHSKISRNEVTILPNKQSQDYTLSGIVLEKDVSGILYHSIGVNGAKASDFNRYPLLFEQLSALSPDLIILSFGTNESFGKISELNFLYQINRLISNIKDKNKNAIIMVTTPPPSLLKRKLPNTLLVDYSNGLLRSNDYVVWDMLRKMGGLKAASDSRNPLMIARDKIHYSREGYKLQAELFLTDFLNAYTNYIKVKSSYEHDFR